MAMRRSKRPMPLFTGSSSGLSESAYCCGALPTMRRRISRNLLFGRFGRSAMVRKRGMAP